MAETMATKSTPWKASTTEGAATNGAAKSAEPSSPQRFTSQLAASAELLNLLQVYAYALLGIRQANRRDGLAHRGMVLSRAGRLVAPLDKDGLKLAKTAFEQVYGKGGGQMIQNAYDRENMTEEEVFRGLA